LRLYLFIFILYLGIQQPLFALSANKTPDPEFTRLLKKAIESNSGFVDKFDAKVWLFDMSNRLARRASYIPLVERMTLLKVIHREAKIAGLDPQLVLAVIDIESGFDHYAISKSGARGLMQVMPFWVNEIGHPKDNLFDIDTNLHYGCTILSLYLKRHHLEVNAALASYNGSLGNNTYPNKVLNALRNRWYLRK